MQYRPFRKIQRNPVKSAIERFRDFQEAQFLFSLGHPFKLVAKRFGLQVAQEAFANPIRKVSHMTCDHDNCDSNDAKLRGGLYMLCNDCYEAFYLD